MKIFTKRDFAQLRGAKNFVSNSIFPKVRLSANGVSYFWIGFLKIWNQNIAGPPKVFEQSQKKIHAAAKQETL